MTPRQSVSLVLGWLGLMTQATAFAAPVPAVSFDGIHNPQAIGPLHAEEPDFRLLKARQENKAANPMDRPIYFDIETVELDITIAPQFGKIAGTSTLGFSALRDDLTSITLDAVDMTILQVTDAGGQELATYYDGEVLTIALAEPLSFQERSLVQIHYETENPQTLYVTGPDATSPDRMVAAYTYTQPLGSRYWFPCLDRPSAKAPTAVTVTVDQGFKVLTNGYLLSRVKQDTTETFSYRLDKPVAPYLVSLAVGAYEEVLLGTYRNGVPVTLWTPPAIRDQAVYETERTLTMLEVFSNFAGTDYPFGSYTQSVAQAWGSSMEHQTVTTMGGMRIVGDRSGEGVVAHELAHQWFGDHVTCETWEDLWLNEGFASYLPMLFFDAVHQPEHVLGQIDWWRKGYFTESETMVRALSPTRIDPSAIFDSHSYEKGALVIHWMRHLANQLPIASGDPAPETFSAVLRNYLQTNGGGNVRHQDLQIALETVTGQSWQRFFDQWVRSPGHPILNASYTAHPDRLELNVVQEQAVRADRTWRTFQFPLEVELVFATGETQTKTIEIFENSQQFSLSTSSPVVAVNLNPRWLVPAEVRVTQSEEAWLAQFAAADSEISRLIAARNILAAYSDKAVPATILDSLLSDPSIYVKADAIALLSADTVHRASVTALVDALADFGCTCSYSQIAIAAGKTWLVKTSPDEPTADDIATWQTEYRDATLHAERAAILERLIHADPKGAQRFAMEQLQNPAMTTRDRQGIVKFLSSQPTTETMVFLADVLADGTLYHLNAVVSNLLASEAFDHPELVELLVDKAKSHRYVRARTGYVRLLAMQTSSGQSVCQELPAIKAAAASFSATTRGSLETALTNAEQTLGCE